MENLINDDLDLSSPDECDNETIKRTNKRYLRDSNFHL